jgi:hypothetical protein
MCTVLMTDSALLLTLFYFLFFLFCYDSVNSRSGLLAATVMTVELDCCDLRFCQFY